MMEQLIVCGGCNAKIGASALDKILAKIPRKKDSRLLVGYESTDDAAVYQVTDEIAIIQTLDFFPPMVTDPYVFGQIAATNAMSDVYAMGGEVTTALNIVAFPEDHDLTILERILLGGANKIQEAGAILSGGHSIHDHSVKYGLSVNGVVNPQKILRNDTCQENDALILTKPLGVSILTVGYSAGEISENGYLKAVDSMTTLNKYAMTVLKNYSLHSCTDVTGFGLLGHLHECLHNEFSAELQASQIPYFKEAYEGAQNFIFTAGGQRNRNYMEDKVVFLNDDFPFEEILFDPQTSGGLLVSLPASEAKAAVAELREHEVPASVIGKVVPKREKEIYIEGVKNDEGY